MVADFPGLASLDAEDNLRNTSDFRGVYRGLLEDWLEVDAAPIIPGASSFAKPDRQALRPSCRFRRFAFVLYKTMRDTRRKR